MGNHRKGIMEEKSFTTKYRSQFWYLALASFLLWLFLLCLYYNSSVLVADNDDTLLEDNYKSFLHASQSDSVHVNENFNGSIGTLPVKGNLVGQETDDFNVINDIVEELDKETKIENKPFNDPIDGVGNFDQRLVSETETRSIDRVLSNNEVEATKGNRDGSIDSSHVSGSRNRKVVRQRKPVDLSSNVEKRMIERVNVKQPRREIGVKIGSESDQCAGRYIYVHDLPGLFNEELLKNCLSLSRWTDMCELTSNLGLGRHLPDFERVSGWFATNQFTSEVIFYNRMKQYKCLTKDSSLASGIFVPYFAGLDVARFLWEPYPYMRDAVALDLMKWLREKPEWKRMWGRDHFMVAGRTTWDFMRTPENESDWGNRLMILPESRNMTMLLIESSPWNYHGFAIPYPTYFHPSRDDEVFQWQNRMRRQKRRYLFSFVGAPRPNLRASIRGEIMDQCHAARRKCKFFECVSGSNKCYKPDQIMKFFQSSTFCLQPPGDSYTRRSTFDSILAGCIPVFFHPGSAYAQYIWHLPKDYTKYSVFIPANEVKEGKASIERILRQIPKVKVVAMREEVIKLIPKVIYANPKSRLETLEDAFDLTIKGVLDRVESIRSKTREGKDPLDFPEEFSWKYNLFGSVEKHEWDPFFDSLRNVR